ncbi:hypothetical protein VUR80DRAFT_3389 [Thermomyces stellatus]
MDGLVIVPILKRVRRDLPRGRGVGRRERNNTCSASRFSVGATGRASDLYHHGRPESNSRKKVHHSRPSVAAELRYAEVSFRTPKSWEGPSRSFLGETGELLVTSRCSVGSPQKYYILEIIRTNAKQGDQTQNAQAIERVLTLLAMSRLDRHWLPPTNFRGGCRMFM